MTDPPVVTELTGRVYAGLPEVYRSADAVQLGDGYPLLRYLAAMLDPLDSVRALFEAIDYVPPRDGGPPDATSVLVDPAVADESWLGWLAQLLGVSIAGMGVDAARAALGDLNTAWAHGSRQAIAAAAAAVVSGSHTVVVTYPYDPARPWVIGLGVHAAEVNPTTTTWAQLMALATPAGGTGPTWELAMAAGPTWFALQDAGSPVIAAEPERPAGYQLELYYL